MIDLCSFHELMGASSYHFHGLRRQLVKSSSEKARMKLSSVMIFDANAFASYHARGIALLFFRKSSLESSRTFLKECIVYIK